MYMLCANQGSVTIRGLRCAKHGSALCAGNPWIVQLLRNPRIAQLTRAYVYSVHWSVLDRASWWIGTTSKSVFPAPSYRRRKVGAKWSVVCTPAFRHQLHDRYVACCIPPMQSKITVRMKNVQSQSGGNDCGLFAIAFAVCLCEGKDPCKFKWS